MYTLARKHASSYKKLVVKHRGGVSNLGEKLFSPTRAELIKCTPSFDNLGWSHTWAELASMALNKRTILFPTSSQLIFWQKEINKRLL